PSSLGGVSENPELTKFRLGQSLRPVMPHAAPHDFAKEKNPGVLAGFVPPPGTQPRTAMLPVVNQEAIERALGIVRQEMGCADVRLELGGRPPETPDTVVAITASGFRLVAVFSAAPKNRASAALRLRQLASSFFDSNISPP